MRPCRRRHGVAEPRLQMAEHLSFRSRLRVWAICHLHGVDRCGEALPRTGLVVTTNLGSERLVPTHVRGDGAAYGLDVVATMDLEYRADPGARRAALAMVLVRERQPAGIESPLIVVDAGNPLGQASGGKWIVGEFGVFHGVLFRSGLGQRYSAVVVSIGIRLRSSGGCNGGSRRSGSLLSGALAMLSTLKEQLFDGPWSRRPVDVSTALTIGRKRNYFATRKSNSCHCRGG
ncbi:unannotated protein [freshwater metagenome]|uniref:Unannotated protein n=1 Tax=freshwater metagenome TaxID=449393 RepID=A0A6J7GNY1_9ZZZZ